MRKMYQLNSLTLDEYTALGLSDPFSSVTLNVIGMSATVGIL